MIIQKKNTLRSLSFACCGDMWCACETCSMRSKFNCCTNRMIIFFHYSFFLLLCSVLTIQKRIIIIIIITNANRNESIANRTKKIAESVEHSMLNVAMLTGVLETWNCRLTHRPAQMCMWLMNIEHERWSLNVCDIFYGIDFFFSFLGM